jgi:hypothetical protein
MRLSPELYDRCLQWGNELADHYARGGSPQSRAYSSHGMEADPIGLSKSKAAECVFALFFGLDPDLVIDWDVNVPDAGFDVLVGDMTKVDVKQVDPHDEYLIWPVRKTSLFDSKNFNVLAAVETEGADGECRGWIGKRSFRRCRLIAGEDHRLTTGTRYMAIVDLHRMGVFPGYADDPREHYCWCGEWGAFGHRDQWWCDEHRPVK